MIIQKLEAQQESLLLPALIKDFMSLFAREGASIRIVGGAVRDALLGLAPKDWDFATPHEPAMVQHLLEKNKVAIAKKGQSFAHGTVFALFKGNVFDVTTLREDVETDGRHARIIYTQDWEKDAQRRDFTINALYADINGSVTDYVGGLQDIQCQHVRFIGQPHQRIGEDVLRILRFFRFYALYDKRDTPDSGALSACRQLAPHLKRLSGERLWSELERLLAMSHPRLIATLGYMGPLLSHVFSPVDIGVDLPALERLLELPEGSTDSLFKFSTLVGYKDLREIGERLHLSRFLCKRLWFLGEKTLDSLEPSSIKRYLFLWKDKIYVQDGLLKAYIQRGWPASKMIFDLDALRREIPSFPIRASDFPELFGIQLGEKLKFLEKMWVESNFSLTKEKLLSIK